VDRFLLNPWLSRASNGVFVVGAVLFVTKRLAGLQALTAVGVVLMAIGLIGWGLPRARRRQLDKRGAKESASSRTPRIERESAEARPLGLRLHMKVREGSELRDELLADRLARVIQPALDDYESRHERWINEVVSLLHGGNQELAARSFIEPVPRPLLAGMLQESQCDRLSRLLKTRVERLRVVADELDAQAAAAD
jgi:hypothetical protein